LIAPRGFVGTNTDLREADPLRLLQDVGDVREGRVERGIENFMGAVWLKRRTRAGAPSRFLIKNGTAGSTLTLHFAMKISRMVTRKG
jgi:hypothetical protein